MPCDLCDGIRGVKVRGIMHIMSILDTFIWTYLFGSFFCWLALDYIELAACLLHYKLFVAISNRLCGSNVHVILMKNKNLLNLGSTSNFTKRSIFRRY